MNVEQALHHAKESEEEGLRGVYPTAAQVLAEEVKALRKKSEAVILLRDLAMEPMKKTEARNSAVPLARRVGRNT